MPPSAPPPLVVPTPPSAPRRRPWRVVFAMSAIFLCGCIVGSAVTVRLAQRHLQARLDPAQWTTAIVRTLERELRLSAAQREAVAPLVQAAASEARASRLRALQETAAIVARAHLEIAAQLDAEQRAKLDALLARRQRFARRWLGPDASALMAHP